MDANTDHKSLNKRTLGMVDTIRQTISSHILADEDKGILHEILWEMVNDNGSYEDRMRNFDKWQYTIDGMEKAYEVPEPATPFPYQELPQTPTAPF